MNKNIKTKKKGYFSISSMNVLKISMKYSYISTKIDFEENTD
jgi:hypothetical protein